MDKGIEMIDESIPAGDDTFVFVKPSEQAFNLPTPTVTPECSTVLRHGLNAIALVWCDQFNALGRKALIERIAVVRLVADQEPRERFREAGVDGFDDELLLMSRTTRNPCGDRKTRAV